MPSTDLSSHAPWLESLRASRARRFAANRARRRRWSGRTGAGVLLASLTIAAGGALAQDQSGGATASTPAAATTATVAQIQSALGVAADGIAGPQTRRALKRFQRAHGLQADGVAGAATIAALGLGGTQDGSRSLDSAGTAPASGDAASALAKIAQCESGGDPTAVSRDGHYRGKYQFTRSTWRSLGGTGDPAKADEATQDAMAAKLYAARGTAPWPVCGA
ncbi:transglycosylase family protein [Candidatus Solirubrobacter pratensis]|uniref:transglycosylase family protein n=1 Tax=Candidatus Solirubrobacter pratensis TaxID=1298857 RepID=UPI0004037E12|nr:transglycosylase family protein [Candidatus Solirubrobacter pratensis]